MTTYAYIKDGVVFNIAHFDGIQSQETLDFLTPRVGADQVVLQADGCEIGGTYANGVFTPKPQPENTVVFEEEVPAPTE